MLSWILGEASYAAIELDWETIRIIWLQIKKGTEMKMQEIRDIGKRYGISSFGKTKAELIREIQRAEGNFDCFGTAKDHCDQYDCCFRSLCLHTDVKPSRKRQ